MRASLVLATLVLAGCASPEAELPQGAPGAAAAHPIGGDAVVVAILDFQGFNPYHLDWSEAAFSSAVGSDASFLRAGPDAYLQGFPEAASFSSYAPLPLTLAASPDAKTADLQAQDEEAWAGFPSSGPGAAHLRYVPGTKIVGLLSFRDDPQPFADAGHGARAASAAAGSVFGTCPECLVVLVQVAPQDEAAIDWVLDQPWIDVVSNSYAFTPTGAGADRSFAYAGCDLDRQRRAAERGQAWFWTGSNGLVAGAAPGATLQSCQMGPDWAVTVGGIDPRGASQSWAGKPVDVAGPSAGYPTQGGETVSNETTMGGTSVATPVNAGTYARVLWEARVALAGASRAQEAGVVAVGGGACGGVRPDCELADGVLTSRELRTRFLHGARHTPQGWNLDPASPEASLPASPEAEFLAEGHGAHWGRYRGDAEWRAESERLSAALRGDAAPPERPDGEAEWFVVDSYCRQRLWGSWADGDHQEGEALPPPDPAWPMRAAYAQVCPGTRGAIPAPPDARVEALGGAG